MMYQFKHHIEKGIPINLIRKRITRLKASFLIYGNIASYFSKAYFFKRLGMDLYISV